MAYAGAEFASKILRAINGEKGIVAPTYVSVAADTVGGSALTKELGEELAFFSSNVEFGVRFFPLIGYHFLTNKLLKLD
jgi:malate dehydrogenase